MFGGFGGCCRLFDWNSHDDDDDYDDDQIMMVKCTYKCIILYKVIRQWLIMYQQLTVC